MNQRISKEEYYLEIAKAVCKRSPCIRRKYGAIIVKNDTIISTGYNGPVRGGINCFEVGCLKDMLKEPHFETLSPIDQFKVYINCPAVHAEENAVINAARSGSDVNGGTMYIYGEDLSGETVEASPCIRCKRILINSGIEKVFIKTKDSFKIVRVSDWIREDSWDYLRKLEDAKRATSSFQS
jgi:dCMP deaminase